MIRAQITVRLNKMPQLEGKVRRLAAQEVTSAAEECAELARNRAPVLSGELRASIEVQPESELSKTVVVGKFYGSFVEFGTHKMAAKPFLTPATETTRPNFLAEMGKIVEKAAS